MNIEKFPSYYEQYVWRGKHSLFGYPKDEFPRFCWIKSLEDRFLWFKENAEYEKTSSRYLIEEMIEWGGSQNGVLQKYNDRLGDTNLYDLLQKIVSDLDDPRAAISAALKLPGLGLTYASKLLRFMNPEMYGALDSRIRGALVKDGKMEKIYDSSAESMIAGYLRFLDLLSSIQNELHDKKILKPDCSLSKGGKWRPADIEMALFSWSE